VPREPFRAEGGLQVLDDGYWLEAIEARLGEIELQVTGRLGKVPDLETTRLRVEARGPRLSALDSFTGQLTMSDEPFTVSGDVQVEGGTYRLDGVKVGVGLNRLSLGGTLVPSATLMGSELAMRLEGPALADVGRLIASVARTELPELPSERFSLEGGLRIEETGYELRDLSVALGTATAHVRGTVGLLPDLEGTDLTLDGSGPNAALFTTVIGVPVPVAPFEVNGRVELGGFGLRFHGLKARLGEYRAEADGFLGEPPRLVGTDLRIWAEGPGLALIADLADLRGLPDLPFEVAGEFEGTPRRFSAESFQARLGSSDLGGSFLVDLEGKPRLMGEFTSKHIDAVELIGRGEQEEAKPVEEPQLEAVSGLLISDEAFDLKLLHVADAEVRLSTDELVLPSGRYRDAHATLALDDARLQLGPVSATGVHGGVLLGHVVVEPRGVEYQLQTDFKIDNGRLDLTSLEDDPSRWPTVDIDVELDGAGASPHGLLSSSNGHLAIILGKGVMDSSLSDRLAADLLVTLLEAFNPFIGKEPTIGLDCAVLLAILDNGVARMEPAAIRTAEMNVLGHGSIDFETESIDVEWVTKPRRGIGLSASVVTEPYLRVGGTIAAPALEVKPLEAMTTTGIAVATGGASVLAKGLYNRMTAYRKVCKSAIKQSKRELMKRRKERSNDTR
jgi:hypothetical protein